MSGRGATFGDIYSAGPYSAGPYSGGLPIAQQILAQPFMRALGNYTAQIIAYVREPTTVGVEGGAMWGKIPIAPCTIWPRVSLCAGCATAVPNNAGAMFP